MSNRDHPVTLLLSDAARGATTSDEQLDALALTPEQRRIVAAGAKAAADLKAEGSNLAARRHSDEIAGAVIASLPAEQQDPGFYRTPVPIPTDPIELARRVARW